MGYPSYSRTWLPDLLPPPRCEAWMAAWPNQGKPAAQCANGANAGLFTRDGHCVCMVHKNAKHVVFNKRAAGKLPPRMQR